MFQTSKLEEQDKCPAGVGTPGRGRTGIGGLQYESIANPGQSNGAASDTEERMPIHWIYDGNARIGLSVTRGVLEAELTITLPPEEARYPRRALDLLAYVEKHYHELAEGHLYLDTGQWHPDVGVFCLVDIARSSFWQDNRIRADARTELVRQGMAFFEASRDTFQESAERGFVYLAQAETGHYKIGYSASPRDRIKHFDTQMPIEVREVTWFLADNPRWAERELHTLLEDYRHKGEWFILPPCAVRQIAAVEMFSRGVFYLVGLDGQDRAAAAGTAPLLAPFTPTTEGAN